MKENWQRELGPELDRRLGQLRSAPQRDPDEAARGRAAYLAVAGKLSQEISPAAAVSKTWEERLNGWIGSILYPLKRKEHFPMLATLTTIITIAALLFGGAGVTAYAAQGSLPDEPLYQLKLMTENLQMNLASGEQAQFELALRLANRRMQEIATQLGDGEPLGDQVTTRLQEHLNLALHLAAGMQDQEMQQDLLRTRLQIQEHLRTMERLQTHATEDATAAIEQVRTMLQTRLRLAELGLEDPSTFRLRLQQGDGQGDGPGPQQEPSDSGQGNGPGPQQEPSDSGQGNGPGPQQEPSDSGQGNGPGPQQEPSDSGQGNGPGPQQEPSDSGQGNGPGPQQEPSDSGQGNGPGPQQEPSDSGQGEGPGPQQEPSGVEQTGGTGSSFGSGAGGH